MHHGSPGGRTVICRNGEDVPSVVEEVGLVIGVKGLVILSFCAIMCNE